MLGTLANFGKEDKYNAIKTIVDGIKSSAKGDFADNRYFRQLRIFAQLRNSLKQEFEKVMVTVSKFFKEENDFFYKRGEEKKGRAVVENLISELGFSDEQAARIAEVPVELVAKIRAELKKL